MRPLLTLVMAYEETGKWSSHGQGKAQVKRSTWGETGRNTSTKLGWN